MTTQRFLAPLLGALLAGCANLPVDRVGLTYHVSPEGDDGNSGGRAMPFATLERARQAVRNLKDAGVLPLGGVTVYLRGGVYPMQSGFVLDERDAGEVGKPIVYRAYPGEEVRLVGGVMLPSSAFRRPTGSEAERVPANAAAAVLCVGLAEVGIAIPESWPDAFRGGEGIAELFFADQPMTPARWPNEGWVTMGEVIDRGLPKSQGGSGSGGTFVYTEDRPAGWDVGRGVWLHGYWCHDWSDETIRVREVDTANRRITLAAPHGYGLGASHGWNKVPRRYYALNLLEELDAPGEWYLDRDAGVLYFWPPAPITSGRTVLSTLRDPIVSMQDTSFITWGGMTLECTQGPGVVITGGSHNRVAGCVIRNTGRQAVSVGGRENGVIGCDITGTGTSGIVLGGGDRRTLQPAGNYAENNHIHHFARRQRTYAAAVHLNGVGNRAEHNLIHDCPHSGILYGGNDHLIAYNEIFHTCLETGDVGALYTGRDWGSQGNVIRRNFIHHTGGVGGWSMGVYLDDCASGHTIEQNIFYRVSRAAFIGGGRYNHVVNNVFVDCSPAVHLDDRGKTRIRWNAGPRESWDLQAKIEAMDYRQPPWSERYPHLVDILADQPELPLHNRVQRNLCVGGKWLNAKGDLAAHLNLEDNLVTEENPGFRNVDGLDFGLRSDSLVWRGIPGFEAIPTARIGLYQDPWRASWPVRRPRLDGGLDAKPQPAAKAASPRPIFTVPASRATIEIDGDLRAEEWRDADAAGALNVGHTVGGTPANLPGEARLLAAEAGLCVGVSIRLAPGSTPVTEPQWGKADAVEIALRLTGSGSPIVAYRGFAGGQWVVSDEAGAPTHVVQRAAEGVAYAARTGDGEWTAEWLIPWKSLGLTGRERAKLPFNLTIRRPADGAWIMWQGTGSYSWQVDSAGFLQLP